MKECNVYGFKKEPGTKYRPGNGIEGMEFEAELCQECTKEDEPSGHFCEIHTNVLVYDTQEKEYPEEWCYSENGNPTCTAFEQKP